MLWEMLWVLKEDREVKLEDEEEDEESFHSKS